METRKYLVYPKLKYYRAEYNLSMQDMANKLNISKNAYFKKENGYTTFYLDEVKKILEIFNCNFDDIFFTNDVN